MNTTEIILLLLGIAIFISSFVIPEQKSKATESDKRLSHELVKESMEQEIGTAKSQIQNMAEETVNYSIEKTERTLEKLTNEKIQAVNEYSDTVLVEIHKNHKEVLFLYDMLNDKQQSIQNAIKDVDKITKSVGDKVSKEQETVLVPPVEEASMNKKPDKEEKVQDIFTPFISKEICSDQTVKDSDFIVGVENNKNNKEKILNLHKSGKSTVTIAKELDLGVGEVKLVIDLFEGM